MLNSNSYLSEPSFDIDAIVASRAIRRKFQLLFGSPWVTTFLHWICFLGGADVLVWSEKKQASLAMVIVEFHIPSA